MEFLTMSDLRFLPQTLTLYRSLERHADHFSLAVLCTDEPTLRYFRKRGLRHVEPVELSALEREEPALRAARQTRSWTEFCWTATPVFCRYALGLAPPGAVRFWIDADVEFVREPSGLLDELGTGSLLLTPHRYQRAFPIAAPALTLQQWYGRFNGGTIGFRRDEPGLAACELWRERTLHWCHDRREPGRFGNQRYLDDFPERSGGAARILAVPGGVLGPWNGGGFTIRRGSEPPTADGAPVIAYHYQSLRVGLRGSRTIVPPNSMALGPAPLRLEARAEVHYRLSRREWRVFWRPHVLRLANAVTEVLEAEPAYASTVAPVLEAHQCAEAWQRFLTLQSSRLTEPLRRRLSGPIRRHSAHVG
jgi:hypothetical protein